VVRAATNYVGFGVDAKVALDFHSVREAYPHWFTSQSRNRLVYTGLGATDIPVRSQRGLPREIAVWCDGVRLDLPPGTEGVLFLNIASYAGGVDLWATGTGGDSRGGPASADGAVFDADPPPPSASFGDGRLEVVAVYGTWHLGQLQVGLSRALRLGQCSRAVVVTSGPLAVQVDGEPWLQTPPSRFDIAAAPTPARMLRRLPSGPLARLAESVRDALAAAQRKGVVTPAQRAALETELAATMHRV
jgi:diacylglycerol kinase (ATP)